MNKIMKTLSLMFAIGAMLFSSGLHHEDAKVAKAADSTWNLVTDASTLSVGDSVIIAAKDSAVALSTIQNNNNRGKTDITKTDSIAVITDDTQILTLENGTKDNTFAFNTGSGYLYAASSSKNYLKTETNLSDNSSWTISITTAGIATITAQGSNTRNWLRYNNSDSLFSCYASGQQDVTIYKFVSKNYDTLLKKLSELDTCSDYNQATKLRNAYNNLSDNERNAFGEEMIIDNEKNTGNEVTIKAIDKLAYMELLKAENEQPSSSLNLFSNNNSNNLALILIIGLLGLSSIAGYYFLNKKKYSR